jgi:hypothetical protein
LLKIRQRERVKVANGRMSERGEASAEKYPIYFVLICGSHSLR